MPKTTKGGQPRAEELPGTLRRSPRKAQRTFAKAHDSAAEQYGDEERANRVAYNAVKHQFQKVGDHWEPKGPQGPFRRAGGEPESAGEPRPDRWRRRREGQLQAGVDESGRQARHPRPLEDDQAGTRRGNRQQAGLMTAPVRRPYPDLGEESMPNRSFSDDGYSSR